MQKSARIELIARNSALKSANRAKKAADRQDWKLWHFQQRKSIKAKNDHAREERLNRREDWIAGPLAPSRNYGKFKGSYGAVEAELVQPATIPKHARSTPARLALQDFGANGQRRPKNVFKGKTIVGNLAVNDRVVVVEGPARIRGLVGTVKSIGEESETVILKDINTADIRIPPFQQVNMTTADAKAPLIETNDLPIPMTSVRLVHDIEDPLTGRKKPVIVRHVYASGPYSARSPFSSWPSHTRYATGTGHLTSDGRDIRLDWPEEVDGEIPRRADDDTSRGDVEHKSWIPSVHTSPLGYDAETIQQNVENPELRYTAGIPVEAGAEARYHGQRIGLHGFVDHEKLLKRQERIGAGIMAELKGTRKVDTQSATDYIKQRALDDARSIWWSERQILSPEAEAAKRAAEAKRQAKEDQLSRLGGSSARSIVEPELEQLVTQMQTASLQSRYNKADRKLRKQLTKSPNAVVRLRTLEDAI